VHEDSAEHVALLTRMLRLNEATWRSVLARYDPVGTGTDSVLEALTRAVGEVLPERERASDLAGLPADARGCPICGTAARSAHVRAFDGDAVAPLVYARCNACGHLALIAGAEPASVYADPGYYAAVSASGAGYHDYADEREYREAKGARLVEWLESAGAPSKRLLEVGSGFGYTRKAAADRGWATSGVDVSAHAAQRARALYGMETHTGTLAACTADGRVARAGWDVVLYQFVLEHVPDPLAELRVAVEALAPGGTLAIVVPSADAAEIAVFGARYRSFRADHLHVFSRRSLAIALGGCGVAIASESTTCSVHLLRGMLDDGALAQLYADGRGPDLHVLGRRNPR
jgi:protein-L-isoaspartate O-methyltransferase